MKNLSMYLPPFSPDYSGICSALFEFNGMIIIHDAAGCTGNYVGFDEPRWYGSKKAVYCSALRKMDVVLGNEQKYIDRIISASKVNNPEFIAFVGSPVPLVMGTDFEGVCMDIETATGIPCFGFPADISKFYGYGIAEGTNALLKRFLKPVTDKKKGQINILGATPIDFTEENFQDMKEFFKDAGYTIGCSLSMDVNMEQVRNLTQSEINIAVSQGGVLIGEYLKNEYGMPYVCGVPIGEKGSKILLKQIEKILDNEEFCYEFTGTKENENVLIIYDAVTAMSMKNSLQEDFNMTNVTIATPFGMEGNLPDVLNLEDEGEILDLLNKEEWDIVISDPMITKLLKKQTGNINLAHYGVSSKIGRPYAKGYIYNKFNNIIKETSYEKQTNKID
ncbi:MAG: nitrogenase component 1 [Eubacteriales bacterium]